MNKTLEHCDRDDNEIWFYVHCWIAVLPFKRCLSQCVSPKIAIFTTFFVSPGNAPGAITLNVVWMEREFDAYKLSRCMCPSKYNRFWDTARYTSCVWWYIAACTATHHLNFRRTCHAVGRCNYQTWSQICRIKFSCSATNYIVTLVFVVFHL